MSLISLLEVQDLKITPPTQLSSHGPVKQTEHTGEATALALAAQLQCRLSMNCSQSYS